MKFAKLDKNNKVINVIKIEASDAFKLENDLNIVDVTGVSVNYGDVWNPKEKTFFTPEKSQKEIDLENEKTIYDEVKELKEKLISLETKNELSTDISAGLK